MTDTTTARGQSNRVAAVAMILGPLLLLGSTGAALAGDGLGADATSGVLQVHAFAWLMLATGALLSLVGDGGAATAALRVVTAFGIAGGVAYGINSVYAARGSYDLNEEQGAATSLGLQLPGIMFPLSFIALGLLLHRAGTRPRWSPLLLIAGGILFPISRIGSIDALAPVPDVLFLLALAPIGLALLRGDSVLD